MKLSFGKDAETLLTKIRWPLRKRLYRSKSKNSQLELESEFPERETRSFALYYSTCWSNKCFHLKVKHKFYPKYIRIARHFTTNNQGFIRGQSITLDRFLSASKLYKDPIPCFLPHKILLFEGAPVTGYTYHYSSFKKLLENSWNPRNPGNLRNISMEPNSLTRCCLNISVINM